MANIDTEINKVIKSEMKRKRKKAVTLHKDEFKNTNFARNVTGVEFWIEDELEHEKRRIETDGLCCFWHIIGLPEKEHLIGLDKQGNEILEKKSHPMYDYELEIYNNILHERYIRIKKATGLGITTLLLGTMVYLCVKDDEYKDQEMIIVTGPRQQLADDELDRIYNLFIHTDYRPKRAESSIWINGCKITAYPSHSFDSARGMDKCRFFFVDEADFFPQTQIETVMTVLERYEAKTHPHVILNSTVNRPTGLYAKMDKGKYSHFKTMEVFYERGIGKIYTEFEIEQAKRMPSFEREYNGNYGMSEGNIFPYNLVDQCVERYLRDPSDGRKCLAIDPAFGTSKFAIIAFEIMGNGEVYIDDAIEFDRPSPSAMVEKIVTMSKTHPEIVIDDSDPGLRKELWEQNLNVFTVNFRTELQKMTLTAAKYVKDKRILIHPCFEELIYQLKSVRFNERGHPDKSVYSFDLVDAFLMAMNFASTSHYSWFRF